METNNTDGTNNLTTDRKRTLAVKCMACPADRTCASCGAAIVKGSRAWLVRGGGHGFGNRCLRCGPHPELTGAVDAGTAPSDVASTEQIAALRAELEHLRGVVNAQVRVVRVEITTPAGVRSVDGAHKKLTDVLRLINAGIQNVYMVGPAGSGKTTLAEQLSKALGREFGFLSLSGGVNETHLLGRVLPQADGAWTFKRSRFVEVYENGGVFLLDEVDAADPNVLVTINAALANGQLSNPISGTVHKRHADTVIICAANTFGTGADAQFVGRNQLDAATLDRFVCAIVEVDYDREVERGIAERTCGDRATEILAFVWTTRERVQSARMRRTVGTRMVVTACKLAAAGFELAEIKGMALTGWSEDERRRVMN